jgi:molecular chaperone GrpE
MESKKSQPQPPKDASSSGDAKKIVDLEKAVKDLTELAARSQAELQNAKIRMEKEATDIRLFASESLLKRLLPTIDNFQRAFAHLPEDLKDHDWVKGVAAIEQDLMKQLSAAGLSKMEAVGHDIDPHKHEVLLEGEGEAGKVLEVLEDGYELHGKVLRPAKVRVGKE